MARLLLRDLTPGANYKVQLRAVEGDSVSEWSRLFNLPTTSDTTPPHQPVWAEDAWVVNGDTFVATWLPLDFEEEANKDFSHYELELSDGLSATVVRTNNTSYTLVFEQNRIFFGTPRATVTARVRSVDAVGNASAWTALKTASNPAPASANSITTTALYDAISVSWDGGTLPDDFKSFTVQVSTTSGTTGFTTVYEGPNSQYQHPTTMFLTDHWFRVYVKDKFNTLSPSITSSAVRPKSSFQSDITPPAMPTAFSAAIVNNANGVGARGSLSWNQVVPLENDLAGFRVRWRKVGDTAYSQTDFSAEDRAAVVELQSSYQNYEFQIRSYDGSGNFSNWTSTVTATSPNAGTPAQTVGLSSVAGRTDIRYTWTDSTATNLREYEVTVSASPTFASGNVVFKVATPLLVVSGMTPSTTYYARVRAINVASTAGAWSATNTTTTLAQLTPGDIGAPTTGDLNDLSNKVDDSIKTYVTEYAVNSSESTAPTSGWSVATPSRTPGSFIWVRTVVTYHDNTTSTTNPALLTGNTGAQGSQGIPGTPGSNGVSLYTWLKYADTPTTGMSDSPTGKAYMGIAYNKASSTESSNYADYDWSLVKGADGSTGAAGKGISSTVVTYQVGTSGTTAPTGTWQSTPQATATGQFHWTRTITTYTDATNSTAYAVAAHGSTGSTGSAGAAGRGITGTVVDYAKHTNGTTAPSTGWGSTIPTTAPGEFLWTRTTTSYSAAPTSVVSYSVSAHGQTGAQGIPGAPGADGQTTYTWVKYATNATGAGMSDDPAGMTYIGLAYNKTTATESTTASDYQWALIKGADGSDGAPGAPGSDGRGISSTAVTYQTHTSGTVAPTGTWQGSPTATTTGQFLWTRTITTYTDATTSTSYAVSAHGATGSAGANGRGISSTAVTYQVGSSGTTAPTGTWQSTVQATAPGQFLWIRTITTFTSAPLTETAYAVSAHGNTGATGQTGATGKGVTSITPYFQTVTTGAAAPAAPTVSPPVAPWVATEPAWTANTELYRTERVLYTDATFAYTAVTKVSSYTAAVQAMTAANGKTRLMFSGSAPTTTTPGRPGDIYWVRSGDIVTEQWLNTAGTDTTSGNTWVKQTLSESTIGNLNAAKITAGTIDAARINTANLVIGGTTLGNKIDAEASKGTDLVVNGFGTMGSNYNFSSTSFTAADAPLGAAGSFIPPAGVAGGVTAGEFLPVDPTKKLKFSHQVRQTGASVDGRFYSMVVPFDAYKQQIYPYFYMYIPNTTTTLATDLKPGDTTISLTSSANWYGSAAKPASTGTYLRSIIFWDYKDPGGKTWPAETYSRNYYGSNYWSDGGIVGNTITLNAPYSGPLRPAGTKLSNGSSGGTYMYVAGATNAVATAEWKSYSGSISGVVDGGGAPTGQSAGFTTGWPQGTGYAKVGWLVNRLAANGASDVNSTMAFAAVSFSDATAAQDMASSVQALTDGWKFTGTTEINGGAIRTDTIDVVKLKANSTFTQNLNVASTFTAGTASTNGIIQSYGYVANSTGWRLDKSGLEINNGKVKASTLIGDTIGSSTGTINVALGASIVLNGGAIRSNTYNGTSGFSLSDSGLVINSGLVSASTLKAGTISGTNEIILSGAGAKITGGNWSLSGTGLTIPDGAISASKLLLQAGNNIVPPMYADFEAMPSTYKTNVVLVSGAADVAIAQSARFNSQSLSVAIGASTENTILSLGRNTADYNVPVEAGVPYIFSAYVWNPYANSTNVHMAVQWSTGSGPMVSSATLPPLTAPSGATRLQASLTPPAGVTGAILMFGSDSKLDGCGFNVDGIQVERQLTSVTTASPWGPSSSTSIDGGQINTGSIRSNAQALDAEGNPIADLAAWDIDTDGQAQFGDVLIRGSVTMGLSGAEPEADPEADEEDLTGVSVMKSYNYVPNQSGWAIKSNGNAEFRQLAANSISADAISAVSPDKMQPGIMSADIIIGTSMRSIESEILYVTHKARDNNNIATLTLSQPHGRVAGDRIRVTLDQDVVADTSFDTPGNLFESIIDVPSATTIRYKSTGPAVSITEHAGGSQIYVEGRSVSITPAGVTLFSNDGQTPVVSLPTDPINPAYFAGNVEANSLTVLDDFLLQGPENYIASGGVLTLNASVVQPASTPTVDVYWPEVQTNLQTQNTAWRAGLLYVEATDEYVTTNTFFGGSAEWYGPDGKLKYTVPMKMVGNSVGITRLGSNYYTLQSIPNSSTNRSQWKVVKYANSGTGLSTVETYWTYDLRTQALFGNITAAQWEVDGWNGSLLRDPAIGTDGVNIIIARPNKEGRIIISTHNANTGDLISIRGTNVYDNQNLKSVQSGSFDLGVTRWVVTTTGSSGKPAQNYVIDTTTNNLVPSETFASPNGVGLIGTTWAKGAFRSLGTNRKHYTYSGVAKTGSQIWYFKSTWFKGDGRLNNISGISGTAPTTTITTALPHGYAVGDTIYVESSLSTVLNGGYYEILTTPTATTFTINSGHNGSLGSGGTVTNQWETPMSPYSTSLVARRAHLTVSASSVPAGDSRNMPDRAVFYHSLAPTAPFWRIDNQNPTKSITVTSDPVYTTSTVTRAPFPAGTPAVIKSNNGLMEITADGRALFGSNQDASTEPGNKPALRLGNPNSTHLRIDDNEIIAMANAGTQGSLYLNDGGTTFSSRLILTSASDASTGAGNTPALRIGNIVSTHLRIDGDEIIAMANNTTRGLLTLNDGGQVKITDLNVVGAFKGATSMEGALTGNNIITRNGYGFFDLSYSGGGTSGASINNNGRVTRTSSSARLKKYIQPLELNEAKKALELEPVTFQWRSGQFMGDRRVPGFIAEQAHDVGMDLWVTYDNDDPEDTPSGFRYQELTAAHNLLIKDLYAEIESLKSEVALLRG